MDDDCIAFEARLSLDDPEVKIFPPTVKEYGDPRKDATWNLMPPPPGTCSQCARTHEPDAPHDAWSLHYQYSFYAEYERWPTWIDAMAHCDQATQDRWLEGLRAHGVVIGDEKPMTHAISHYAEVWPGSGMYTICECDAEFPSDAHHAQHQRDRAKGNSDGQ